MRGSLVKRFSRRGYKEISYLLLLEELLHNLTDILAVALLVKEDIDNEVVDQIDATEEEGEEGDNQTSCGGLIEIARIGEVGGTDTDQDREDDPRGGDTMDISLNKVGVLLVVLKLLHRLGLERALHRTHHCH